MLDLVHGDLCGPIIPVMHGGRRYSLLLVNNYSRFMWLQLLASKDEAAAAIKGFQARAEAKLQKKLRVLRTDRGGEFTLVEFSKYCSDSGVAHHLTAHYSPQQNGVVERQNQTDIGMAVFWARQCPQQCSSSTAQERKRKPDISFLRTFGCVGHVKSTKSHLSKPEDRSKPMVLLGFKATSKAYRLFDPRGGKVVISCDVVFDTKVTWDWGCPGTRKADEVSDTFIIKHPIIHGGGQEQLTADARSLVAAAATKGFASKQTPPATA